MAKRYGLALVAALVFSAAASAQTADPYGKYDKPVTINIGYALDSSGKFPDGDSPDNNVYTRYLKDTFNIVVKSTWQASGDDASKKINLSIASNDLPDAMVVNDAQLRQMLKAGQLQDMGESWNKYASPILKSAWNKTNGTAVKASTFGGKMMAIPSIFVTIDQYDLTWIRKDWLDALGMKPPKTLAELEAVAKAFVEKDPGKLGKGKTVGIAGPANGGALFGNFLTANSNNTWTFEPVAASLGAYPGFWVKGKDGKAAYGSIQPETKAVLGKLADLYKKGLIDPQMGVRKDATESIVAGQAGIMFAPWWMGYWPIPDAIKQTPSANWQAYPVPLSADGKWTPHTGTSHTGFLVVRKGYEHPEAVVKMINGYTRDQKNFDVSATPIGNYPLRLVITPPDEMFVSYQAAMAVKAGTKKIEDYMGPEYQPYALLIDDIKSYLEVKKAPFDKMDISTWDTSSPKFPRMYSLAVGVGPLLSAPAGVQLPWYSSTKTIETKWASLKKMEDETFINIVLGGKPLSAFDEFVTKWKAQGGDTITAEVQKELE